MKEENKELEEQYASAKEFVIGSNRASISGIQRRFKLGFNRAARIIERMEEDGIVTAPNDQGRREVFGV